MTDVPRIDSVSQSIAISGFTNGGKTFGYIDLTTSTPAGSIVLGAKGDITTRFTGGVLVTVEIGTPGDPERYCLAKPLSTNAGNAFGSGSSAFNQNAQKIRVTVRDAFDFDSVSGGALTVTVYFVRTVA